VSDPTNRRIIKPLILAPDGTNDREALLAALVAAARAVLLKRQEQQKKAA
jgi:hypothetical protein